MHINQSDFDEVNDKIEDQELDDVEQEIYNIYPVKESFEENSSKADSDKSADDTKNLSKDSFPDLIPIQFRKLHST